MLQKCLLVAIVSLLAGASALGPNLVKSQAQSQVPPPSQLPAPLSPTERLDEWSKNSPNEPIPAGIFFDKRIPDAQLVQLMRRYNVQPQAVYLISVSLTHSLCN